MAWNRRSRSFSSVYCRPLVLARPDLLSACWERILVERLHLYRRMPEPLKEELRGHISDEVQPETEHFDGKNVVLHEFAHPLDQKDGAQTGRPFSATDRV